MFTSIILAISVLAIVVTRILVTRPVDSGQGSVAIPSENAPAGREGLVTTS